MKEKIKVTLPFTMTFNEALKYKNVKFSTAKEDINYTGNGIFMNALMRLLIINYSECQ